MLKMSNVKQAVLTQIGERKGLKSEQVGRLDAALRRVAFAESKGDATAVQESGGPGRGKYQHELGASTEALSQRLKNYEKVYGEVPLSDVDRKALEEGDMSKVSEDAQDALTLVGWVMKTPGDEVGELARGNYKMGQFWLDYHWAGAEEDRQAKKEQWVREMRDYQRIHGGVR
jgi:hypothetical protein